jgi:ATP/maltotriose-dependent transcriptional regulator MalT
LERFGADGFDFQVNNNWTSAVVGFALVAGYVGGAEHTEQAQTLYDLLAPWPGQIGCNRGQSMGTTDGALARLAALLGRHDDAEAHFAAAEEMTTALDAKFFAAQDDLARAELHRARGDETDRAKAEWYATRALENARENDYASVERRASAFLDELTSA